jgi:ribosome-associated protein
MPRPPIFDSASKATNRCQSCCLPPWNPIYFTIGCIRRKPIVPESKAKAIAIAAASLEKKAEDVLVLHVAKLTSVADYLVLCSGESERQVKAIADHIDQVLSRHRERPLSIEGMNTAQWILMDFGDVVVHVFKTDVRDYYGLERLWGDARRVRVPVSETPSRVLTLSQERKRTPRASEQG